MENNRIFQNKLISIRITSESYFFVTETIKSPPPTTVKGGEHPLPATTLHRQQPQNLLLCVTSQLSPATPPIGLAYQQDRKCSEALFHSIVPVSAR